MMVEVAIVVVGGWWRTWFPVSSMDKLLIDMWNDFGIGNVWLNDEIKSERRESKAEKGGEGGRRRDTRQRR